MVAVTVQPPFLVIWREQYKYQKVNLETLCLLTRDYTSLIMRKLPATTNQRDGNEYTSCNYKRSILCLRLLCVIRGCLKKT